MRFLIFLSILFSGCTTTDGFFYVQEETLNNVLVQECKTIWMSHSEDPNLSHWKQECRRFFMTPHQLAGWKGVQASIKERRLPNGIVVQEDD